MISILNHFSLLRMLVIFDWWKHINMDVTLPFWVIMRSTDVTKDLNVQKSIYGHDDALVAVWLMVKKIPAPRRKNNQIWPPSMQYDSSYNDYGSFYVDVFFPPSVPWFYRKWLFISNTVELLILREHLRARSVLWWDSCCSSSFFLCCSFKFIYE
jgi:hypothetical protein